MAPYARSVAEKPEMLDAAVLTVQVAGASTIANARRSLQNLVASAQTGLMPLSAVAGVRGGMQSRLKMSDFLSA